MVRPSLVRFRGLGAVALGAAGLAGAVPCAAQAPAEGGSSPRQASPPRLPALAVHRTADTAGCPDARALAERVARHMKRAALEPLDEGHASDARPDGLPSLDVQIYRSEEGYTAVVRTLGAKGEGVAPGEEPIKTRQLTDKGPTCDGLADALSILLAVLLDTEVPLPPPPPAPPQRPPPAQQRPRAAAPQTPPRRRPPPEAPRAFSLAAVLGYAPFFGVLEHGGIAGAGYLEARIRERFLVTAGAVAFPRQTFRYTGGLRALDGSYPEIGIWLTAGQLRGCYAAPLTVAAGARSSSLGGCVGLLVGALHGEGITLPRNQQATRPWAAAEASVFLEQRLFWRLSLVSRATVLIPFVRQRLTVEGEGGGTAFTPSPIGLALDTSLRLSIW